MNIYLNLNSITPTKQKVKDNVLALLADPIRKLGHNVTLGNTCENFDAVFMYGCYNPRWPCNNVNLKYKRNIEYKKMNESGAKVVCIDATPFYSYMMRSNMETHFYRFSNNSCTGDGDFKLSSRSPERLLMLQEKYKINIKNPKDLDKKEDNKPIIIAMQVDAGWTFDDPIGPEKWTVNVINEIRKHSSSKIIVKTHPRTDFRKIKSVLKNHKVEIIHKEKDRTHFADLIHNAKCMITHSSTSSFVSWIEGVPVISTSSRCMNYQNYLSNISDINLLENFPWDKRLPELQKWVNATWEIDEINKDPSVLEKYIT